MEREFGRQAREIRAYVLARVAQELAATPDSQCCVPATDVATALRLTARFPNICTAIDSQTFERELRQRGIAMVKRTGPRQSSTVTWTFAFADEPSPSIGEAAKHMSPPPPASKPIRFTLSGQAFEKERNDLIKSIAGKQPGQIRKYSTNINGTPYPIRQVLSVATGMPAIAITSQEAFRVLAKFGFAIDIH
jgi:hypothetical protein